MRASPADAAALPPDPALRGRDWLLARGSALRLVHHRPGRRMVVEDAGPPATYWKLYRDGRGARAHDHLRSLSRLAAAGALPFAVPEPLEYRPEARALRLAAVAGRPLVALEGAALVRVAALAGRALAALHRGAWRPARAWTLEDEWAVTGRDAPALERADPALGEAARALAARIAGAAAGGAPAALHRDLHPGQVLWDGGDRVALLDWDDAACGPAAIDVGNLLAHLWLEVGRRPAAATPALAAAADAFVDAYAADGVAAVGSLAPFTAAALVRLAGLAVERRGDVAEAAWLLGAAARALTGAAPAR